MYIKFVTYDDTHWLEAYSSFRMSLEANRDSDWLWVCHLNYASLTYEIGNQNFLMWYYTVVIEMGKFCWCWFNSIDRHFELLLNILKQHLDQHSGTTSWSTSWSTSVDQDVVPKVKMLIQHVDQDVDPICWSKNYRMLIQISINVDPNVDPNVDRAPVNRTSMLYSLRFRNKSAQMLFFSTSWC